LHDPLSRHIEDNNREWIGKVFPSTAFPYEIATLLTEAGATPPEKEKIDTEMTDALPMAIFPPPPI
jgi:hypothetical protein